MMKNFRNRIIKSQVYRQVVVETICSPKAAGGGHMGARTAAYSGFQQRGRNIGSLFTDYP